MGGGDKLWRAIAKLGVSSGTSNKDYRSLVKEMDIAEKGRLAIGKETKLGSISEAMAGNCWGHGDVGFSYSASNGASGGLLILWNPGSVEVVCSFKGEGYLGVKVRWKNFIYYIVNIYSPCSFAAKRSLWMNLLKIVGGDGEWIFGGDFNAVKTKEERRGCSVLDNRREWVEFSDFIDRSDLSDIPCRGKKFTWFSGDGKSKSRIDHFLVADATMDRWGVVGQFVDLRDISDHCPIWIMVEKSNWGPKPFRSNNEWFSHKDFLPFVEKEWLALSVEGRGEFVLKEKLKLLKSRLKWWNINIFGRIELEMQEGIKDMNAMDEWDAETSIPMDPEVVTSKRKLSSSKFWLNLKIKENMLIQKSRLNWLNDGDNNSKFFHSVMKGRRRLNHIGPLVTQAGMIESVEGVRE
ncbi:uncharacterized protein LOC131659770 [Vicia villosa]|uniref:uncharacterized protein LOC131659770 n=1 Tax=Vicia villosa TaxID=3911 RepID=UPI00273AE584|nr:uncharacterized protein LOC131659770 [Vicia villosa]